MPFSLDDLRRWPDLETAEGRAWDAADALILDEAAALVAGSDAVVIGDDYGALTLGALDRGAASVRVHQDPITCEQALAANASAAGLSDFASLPLTPELLRGATLVLLRLPRALGELEQIAALVATHADPAVVVIAGGRIKHMSLGMNDVLARYFGRVDVSLARQKSRLLIARSPRPGAEIEPSRTWHADLGLWVVATGGAFAGSGIDIGTRAMLGVLDRARDFETAIDLGCGTGVLAVSLAKMRPGAHVIASDRSAAAVASARLTAEANGVDVEVTRDAAISRQPDASADLVVLNPPFHEGAAVDVRLATALFEASARVLRPGGELLTVFNSHLGYRPQLERIVGATRQLHRDRKFTVTSTTVAR